MTNEKKSNEETDGLINVQNNEPFFVQDDKVFFYMRYDYQRDNYPRPKVQMKKICQQL